MIERVSKRAFSGSSGTYHVRASELALLDRRHKVFNVNVIFLDGTTHNFAVQKRDKGSALLNLVFKHLELYETDYFGLQYHPNGVLSNGVLFDSDTIRWLDPSKSVKKQLSSIMGQQQHQLYFRVKFYVTDPSKLLEEFTRYQFYLQLRMDISSKKLILPPSTACLLASYMVQSEIGDYQPDEHDECNYLSKLSLIPDQNEDLEKKIAELHKLHKGQLPSDAEFNFLDQVKRLDMYGVELHNARDSNNREIQIGVTSIGLVIFQNNIRINTFSWSKIMKISFKRKQFFIQLRHELSESYDTILGFNMLSNRSSKTLWKTCVEHHTFFRLHASHRRVWRFPMLLGSRFQFTGRTECETVAQGKRSRARNLSRFIRKSAKTVPSQTIATATVPPTTSTTVIPSSDDSKIIIKIPSSRSPWCDNKVTSSGSRKPRKAWEDSAQVSDDDGGFLEPSSLDEVAFTPAPGRVLGYADEDDETSNAGLYDTPPYSLSNSPTTSEGLISIHFSPDKKGRFGFNVRGGSEHNMPILISRVAPNTPADRCVPKLREGDQLVSINGYDVTNASHSLVVTLIRAARDKMNRKLVLTIRPMPTPESVISKSVSGAEEPAYCYVPDSPQTISGGNSVDGLVIESNNNPLVQSMLLIVDGAASGALIRNFSQLYQRNPDLTSDDAKRPENVDKNRYRDISPYDSTRVKLHFSNPDDEKSDYINASHVDMQITGTDIVNRFIAAQGPLSSTCDDFWQMTVENDCGLIVMLTTLSERGRIKCHQYWPNIDDEALHIKSINYDIICKLETQDPSDSYVYREFLLTNLDTKQEHIVKHMQFLSWPDHFVPQDYEHFLEFTYRIRKIRSEDACSSGINGPIIVHCSAGIGRTGALILLDTALCLIEANQPIYPLDIVKTMRDQRAMMIQHACQYVFICDCICNAYQSGDIKPPSDQQ